MKTTLLMMLILFIFLTISILIGFIISKYILYKLLNKNKELTFIEFFKKEIYEEDDDEN
jgi:uncharacterized protein YneF (UPF0154 family)